jgi:septal ring-binding cell division protein DamX
MHPRTLLRLSLIIMVTLIACLVVSGCGKKQKKASLAKMTQVSKEPASDTTDIFKEFYSEDSAKKNAGGKQKAAAEQTFSPSASSSSFQPEFSSNGRYTVQITCVRSQSFANGMTEKMKDKGYPAYVAEVQNPTPNLSGAFYRVRIGGFAGLSAAKAFGENILIPSGYEYWVDNKSNDNVGMEGYGLGSGSAGSNAASSYDNAGSGSTSSYQPSTTSSSYESSTSSNSQQPASSSTASSTGSASTGSSSVTATPATPSQGATPSKGTTSSPQAAPSTPSSTPSGSTTSTGSSTESGWGSDSASKSGW